MICDFRYAIIKKTEGGIVMNVGVNYSLFYEILLNLRESFHGYGRIDDANSKLDEIVKIIYLSYFEAINGRRFCLSEIRVAAKKRYNDESQIAPTLREMFEASCDYSPLYNSDGTNVFGANPSLNIQPSENAFAEKLVAEIEKIDFINLVNTHKLSEFDIINECFGHFVRENFRNNKEDAQYMTPAEISSPIIDMIFHDIIEDDYLGKADFKDFRIMDPTCGVGTLLIESARKYVDYVKSLNMPHNKTEKILSHFMKNGIIGQDKVDRMVRLSKINAMLMGANVSNIFTGNSILGITPIVDYQESIDLIFTNPPFGAEYEIDTLDKKLFSHIGELSVNSKTICSEILMLLRCIDLLKPNGYLAIVLPDSVFSSKGVFAQIREIILNNFEIKSIVELPAVAFAQAGTRTKTAILYLKKSKPQKNSKIVMSICESIGYTVKERTGVPVKISTGTKDMDIISSAYTNERKHGSVDCIISENPSVTLISPLELIDGIINPGFYNASRLKTIANLQNIEIDGFELRTLGDIVRFETVGRKNLTTCPDTKHISVLHVNPDSTIDFQEVLKYNPISKGRLCFTGDVLFSKINPRIPRTAVIPEFNKTLVCSNEFEIMRPSADVDAYSICLLLKCSYVSKQIENLTSGTSSSHNRIKREQLAQIMIPYPVSEKAKNSITEIGKAIGSALYKKYDADDILRHQAELLEIV